MKTTYKLSKTELKEDEENYHITFKDYRGETRTSKLDEETARAFISDFDKLVNPYEKV